MKNIKYIINLVLIITIIAFSFISVNANDETVSKRYYMGEKTKVSLVSLSDYENIDLAAIDCAKQYNEDYTISKTTPLVRELDIKNESVSFDELKNQAIYHVSILYENEKAIGEIYFVVENKDLIVEGVNTSNYNFEKKMKNYLDKDAVIILDGVVKYIYVKENDEETVTSIEWADDNTAASGKDFLNALVYIRENVEQNPYLLGQESEVMNYIGMKPDRLTSNLIIFGLTLIVIITLATSFFIYKRKQRKK